MKKFSGVGNPKANNNIQKKANNPIRISIRFIVELPLPAQRFKFTEYKQHKKYYLQHECCESDGDKRKEPEAKKHHGQNLPRPD